MTPVLQCGACGREMTSSGLRGLCPQCLFSCGTEQLSALGDDSLSLDSSLFVPEATVGPNGRFRLLDKLGEGGMGEVWLANDCELSEPQLPHFVALKFLSRAIRTDARAIRQLRMEVLSCQKLSHPHIVRVFDLHTTETGMPFIKMEYVDGSNLSQWVQTHAGGVMPWRLAIQLMHQICSALIYAHETVKLVHCDVKPTNLLVAADGIFKLTDFGIAQSVHGHSRLPGDVPAGLGTLWYVSPQQLAGDQPAPTDDIYSLGATFYELLTGSPPFDASSVAELVDRIKWDRPQPMGDRLSERGRFNPIPTKVASLVNRCLDKAPSQRPELRELLEVATTVTMYPVELGQSSLSPSPGGSRRHSWRLAGISVILAFCGCLGLWRFLPPTSRAPVPPQMKPASAGMPSDQPLPTSFAKDQFAKDAFGQSRENTPLTGGLAIMVEPARGNENQDHLLEIRDDSQKLVRSVVVGRGSDWSFRERLEPGLYGITVQVRGDWIMRAAARVEANEEQSLRLRFAWQEKLTLSSEPSGALVEWLGLDRATPESARTPFTARFRSGTIRFQLKAPGHDAVTTNYQFNPAAGDVLRVVLEPSRSPLTGESWTNSLGMEFQWLASLGAWVCRTEVSIGHFREFADATHYQATNGVYSLTSEGVRAIGCTWADPGPYFDHSRDGPAIGLNLSDAVTFCQWLTAKEKAAEALAFNQLYRLPTTNEWKTFAGRRMASKLEGPRPVSNLAGREVLKSDWPKQWSVSLDVDDGYPRTASIRDPRFAANELGLHHVYGNAAEWCAEGVLCGGSWRESAEDLGDDIAIIHPYRLTEANQIQEDTLRRDDRFGFRPLIATRAPTSSN